MPKPLITQDDFQKIDIRTGTIIEIQLFPEAHKPAYKLTIDFGPAIVIKRSSVQIITYYTPQTLLTLLHKQIIAIIKFPHKQIGKCLSKCVGLGIYDANR
ncbi:MAG: hypothetical protein NZL83_04275 [Candidatus Absconditabacterales bacterium]|nr:hypothetical protein [Candidatus Absconditabacterales bacterium]